MREYVFVAFGDFGVETLYRWGPGARHLYKAIAKRLMEVSHQQRAGSYLTHRIGIASQRGNATSRQSPKRQRS